MEFLNSDKFYGNTVTEWAIALGIILGSFVATKIIYWIIANVVKKVTQRTKTNIDDVLIDKLEKPIVYLLSETKVPKFTISSIFFPSKVPFFISFLNKSPVEILNN